MLLPGPKFIALGLGKVLRHLLTYLVVWTHQAGHTHRAVSNRFSLYVRTQESPVYPYHKRPQKFVLHFFHFPPKSPTEPPQKKPLKGIFPSLCVNIVKCCINPFFPDFWDALHAYAVVLFPLDAVADVFAGVDLGRGGLDSPVCAQQDLDGFQCVTSTFAEMHFYNTFYTPMY